jgi:hypothetical protein
MMNVLLNVSQVIRQIDYAEKAILKDIGDSIAQGIWPEFVQLVTETAQYTGTTAASWNLSMGGDHSVRPQPARTRQQALQKGHQAAVQVAIGHNFKSLLDITEKYKHSAIVVENHAPGAVPSETGVSSLGGPLRDVNRGATGALVRFEQRVAHKTFETIRSRIA